MSNPLPNGWQQTLLVDVIDSIVGGGTPSKAILSYYTGNIPWMTVKDMNKHVLTDTIDHITEEAVNKSSSNLIPAGIPIIATRMSLGKIITARFDSAINQDLKAIFLNGNIDTKYFVFWYRSFGKNIEALGTGTTVQGIRLEVLKALPFPLCSIPEQKEIATLLDNLLAQVDTLKTRLDAIPNILKRFRQSVLAAAVSGKLTEQWREKNTSLIKNDSEKPSSYGTVDPKEFYIIQPNTWRWVRFGSQVKLINGDRGKNYPNKSEYTLQGIPFINTGHIEPNGYLSVDRMNYISRAKFNSLGGGKIQADDLVYCLRGATMGKTAIVNPLKEGAIASSLVIIRSKNSIIFKFAYLFLTSPQGKDLILRFDNGSAQPNLSAQSLSLYPIALPPIEEQTEIVRRVEELFAFADQIEQRVKSAQQRVNHLTQSILAKAFRGELTAEWREQNPELICGENSAAALLARIKTERKK